MKKGKPWTEADVKALGFEEQPAIQAAKRCGIQWTPWMGDWFTSWSPRNSNNNAEGSWNHWANLAAMILAHPFTEKVAPHLYRPDLKPEHLYTENANPIPDVEIAAAFASHPEPDTTRGQE